MKLLSKLVLPVLTLLMAGCANENPSVLPGGKEVYDIILTFNVSIVPSAETRAPRELTSTDCRQEANDVRIYLFRSDDGMTDDSFTLFDPGPDKAGVTMMKPGSDSSTVPHIHVSGFESHAGDANIDMAGGGMKWDNDETHSLSLKAKLPEGYYRFLAFGRDDGEEGQVLRRLDWKEDNTTWTSAILTNSGYPAVTEFFSGFAAAADSSVPETIHVSEENRGFLTDIVLHRAVAGGFLYVRNIPEVQSDFDWKEAGVEKGKRYMPDEVAMVSMGHDRALSLPGCNAGNKFVADEDAPLTLAKLVSVVPDEKETFLPDRNYQSGSFLFPARLTDHPIPDIYLDGASETGASLALCFYHKGYPVKLKPIRIARIENLHPDNPGDRYEEASDEYLFDIRANSLYCLGNKNLEDGTDNPIDLKEAVSDDVEIIVMGAWQTIVDIEIE